MDSSHFLLQDVIFVETKNDLNVYESAQDGTTGPSIPAPPGLGTAARKPATYDINEWVGESLFFQM